MTHRRQLISALFLLSLLFLISALPAAAQGNGTISGFVYEADGVTPLIGSPIINLEDFNTGVYVGGATVLNGMYSVDVPPGTYRLRAQGDGYALEFYDNAGPTGNYAASVTVTAGATTSNINFTLEAGGSISGTVYADDGMTPLANVNVNLNAAWLGACTDNDGHYTINDIPLDYPTKVYAGSSGCGNLPYVQEYWNNVPFDWQAPFITLTPAAPDVTGIDFSLTLGAQVTGTVYEADGVTTISNAGVSVFDAATGNHITGMGVQMDGSYSMALLPGTYLVSAQGFGWSTEYYDEAGYDPANATPVTLVLNEVTSGIDFTLDPAGFLSGTVYEADGVTPIPYASVSSFNPATGNHVTGMGVDQNGDFVLSLPPGQYQVNAHKDGWVEEWYDTAGFDRANADVINVVAGVTLTDIDFTLDPAGIISGTVYEADGVTPISNVSVSVFYAANNNHVMGTGTNQNGEFTLSLPPGTYIVNAHGGGWLSEWYDEAGWQDWQNATPIIVTAGATVSDVNFTLDVGGIIRGTVYAADGVTPLANVHVGTNQPIGACTDQNGQFSMEGAPINVPIKVSAGGGNNWCFGGTNQYAQEWYDEVANQNDATPITLTLAQLERNGVDFTLDPASIITGTVYEADGVTPIANAEVNLQDYATNSGMGGTNSDQNGQYTLYVSPGTYKVSATGMGWAAEYYLNTDFDNATPVMVGAGATVSGINFTLNVGGMISGTVYQADGVTPVAFANVGMNMPFGNCADENGAFMIYGIPLNTPFKVHAFADGFSWCGMPNGNFAREWYQEAPNDMQATEITLTLAQPTRADINFTLGPAGTVSGTVYAADGVTPLANVNIEGHNLSLGTCSDANGNYTLRGLPLNQPFKLYTQTNSWCGGGGMYMGEWYDNAANEGDATPITLTMAQPDRAGVNFTLALGGAISGMVYEADGVTPITHDAGVNVNDPQTWNWLNGTGVNPDGSYFIAVAPGQYFLQAGGQRYVAEVWNESGYGGEAPQDLVTVTAGAVTSNINFTLDPGGEIRGTVYAADGVTPLANINIGSATPWLGACTDQNGQYIIGGVPFDEAHYVFAGGNFNWCGVAAGYAQVWWQQKAFEFQADGVTVTETQPIATGIDFTLGMSGSISGTLTAAEDNAPLSDIWVCAINYDADGFGPTSVFTCDQTDANGAYTIEGLSPYQYRMWQFPEDRLRLFYNQSPTYEGATLVNLTAGAHITGIDFSLAQAGIISGYAYLEDGVTPAFHATVGTADGSYMECVQPDGSYRIWVPPGTHIVRIWAGACNPHIDFPTEYYNDATDPANATSVTVGAGEQIYNIDFVRGTSALPAPTLIAPSGAMPTGSPVFSWTPVAGATHYQVWVSQLDGTAQVERWVDSSVCTGVVCSVTDINLLTGAYRWWARAWNVTFGYSPWSVPLDFQIATPPDAPTQVSPFGFEPTQTPMFTWNAVSGASWYYLWITGEDGHVLDQWFAGADVCVGATCSVLPSVNLAGGDYQWWVQAWSPYGGYSAWSAGLNFTMMFFQMPTQIAPDGQQTVTPTHLQWQDMPGSSWWQVWFNDTQGNSAGYWYDAALICAGGVCAVVPPVAITDDAYSWWVQAWNPVAGYSDWSAGMTFWLPMNAPMPTAPAGVVTSASPTFTWAKQAQAAWYYLWVSGTSGHVLDQWLDAYAICAGGTCAVTPLTLPDGDYQFWVQGWSPYSGYSAWSGGTTFTVDAP